MEIEEVKERNSNTQTNPERSRSLVSDLDQLSFGDLLVLANATSVFFSREVVVGPEESLPVGVEERSCIEAGDMVDCGGSCSVLPGKLQRDRELMQQRGEAVPVKLVEEAKPNNNRDPSDGCRRRDKLCEIKYARKKRVRSTTSVGAVAGTCDLAKKLCKHKPSSLINVDDAQREEVLNHDGETHSQGRFKTQSGDENQEIPKRERSQRKRKPKKKWCSSLGERRQGKGRACDQMDCGAVLGSDIADEEMIVSDEAETEEEDVSESEGFLPLLEDAETEEEDVSVVSESEDFLPLLEEAETEEEDVSDVSSCNWWSFPTRPRTSKGIRHVRWSNKKKRNCMTLRKHRATSRSFF